MTSKLWNVLVIIYYISYLILVIPFLVLYFAIANSYRRGRNKRKVVRILKKRGLPKDFYRQVGKSYKKQMKTFTIWELAKAQKRFNIPNKDKESDDMPSFVKSFITT